jgi:histidinol-phosphate aminotransferase
MMLWGNRTNDTPTQQILTRRNKVYDMKLKDSIEDYIGGLPDYVPGEYRPGYIKLASNENNYGPSPNVIKALRRVASRAQLYPYRDDELRLRLGDYAGVSMENIVIGNGSDELIDMSVKVFRGPVAGSYPSFGMYPLAAGSVGEAYTGVRLRDDFTFDGREFLRASVDSRLAFLCSPNNPTGIGIPDDELRIVLDSGRIVVLDEAYFEFSGRTRVGWLRDYPNLAIIRTMSKAFALAGLRVGYLIANADIVRAILKVKIPFSVNMMAQEAALAALDDVSYSKKCVKSIVRAREQFRKALSRRFKTYPSESNFIFADVTPSSSQQFFDEMIKKKIIIRKFGLFKGYPGDYVRVSTGTDKENKRFIDAVRTI